jgi:predicted Zn finger-like uncharacterized protein
VAALIHTLACPACTRELRVPDSLLGQLVKCPSCGNTFTTPESPDQIPNKARRPEWRDEADEPLRPREEEEQDDRPRPRRVEPAEELDEIPNDRPRPRPRRKTPDKIQTISVMTLVGGIVALLWSAGWMLTCFGLLWPGTYFSLVCGIICVIKGCQLLSDNGRGEDAPMATAILQIINVINLDVINLVLGILILVFLNEDEVKEFFRR